MNTVAFHSNMMVEISNKEFLDRKAMKRHCRFANDWFTVYFVRACFRKCV